jgi:alkylhydroperoxidase/carboxymuconolactone decarboxylase family protein YurZ
MREEWMMASERGLEIRDGDVPRTFERFVDRYPELGDALRAMGEAVAGAGPLDEPTAELVKLGVCVGAGLESATKSHARRALQAGASPDQILHAVLQGMNTVGWSKTVMAWQWASEQLADEA